MLKTKSLSLSTRTIKMSGGSSSSLPLLEVLWPFAAQMWSWISWAGSTPPLGRCTLMITLRAWQKLTPETTLLSTRKFGKPVHLWLDLFKKMGKEIHWNVFPGSDPTSREFSPCAVQLNSHANKSRTMCRTSVHAQSFNKRIPFIGIETVPNWWCHSTGI